MSIDNQILITSLPHLYALVYVGLALALALLIRQNRISLLSVLPRRLRRPLRRRTSAPGRRRPA
ncbi:MAG: hypothetical protein HY268_15980 [Deltaproteobacteria bacterium]|nr:hypothetical protein [Deltaproteobacteria bacterium]